MSGRLPGAEGALGAYGFRPRQPAAWVSRGLIPLLPLLPLQALWPPCGCDWTQVGARDPGCADKVTGSPSTRRSHPWPSLGVALSLLLRPGSALPPHLSTRWDPHACTQPACVLMLQALSLGRGAGGVPTPSWANYGWKPDGIPARPAHWALSHSCRTPEMSAISDSIPYCHTVIARELFQ